MQDGIVFWLTGLSGAGKTTIGKLLYEKLKKEKSNVVFLGGDILREVFGSDLFFVEASHEKHMSKERYMGICRSVNDIQVQAGERKFKEILKNIEEIIKPYDEIVVPYKSRAWIVKANQKICSRGGKCTYPVFMITSFHYVNQMYGYCA